MLQPVLRPADILLPKAGSDLQKWAVLACDQFTSQPDYWARAEELVGNEPSTLNIIYPEVYLEAEQNHALRIQNIHKAMAGYRAGFLHTGVAAGYIYLERTLQSGAVRQGLVGCVDLEDYSYQPGAKARIRPSENTVVERIPPRLAVRRGAALESPHILMLADDPEAGIIEPLGRRKETLAPLYDVQLMLDGGRLRGWAVTDPSDIQQVAAALARLEDAERFEKLYGAPPGGQALQPFALAVGDGNHSLATAKAYWEELKQTLPEGQRVGHPARYCLVELENIQSPAIEIESIHRVVFNARPDSLLRAAALYAQAHDAVLTPPAKQEQTFTIVTEQEEVALSIKNPPHPLAVGTLEAFLDAYAENHPAMRVDYVHGEPDVRQLAKTGAIGILLPPFEKNDLFRGVALGGVLPKKTFSMGHAKEKRYYLECRSL